MKPNVAINFRIISWKNHQYEQYQLYRNKLIKN